ncbi:serine/threonine phosphatase stp [Alkalibacterium kapii]|uniref:Serine/threonine phosphatase stp n=2 Tax=Alkalibacterium kapii TaxID=426704 RepID=A0A511AU90_9LACT|nr:serine/threonine phosphatase stp [Alkalibacterium kapii]
MGGHKAGDVASEMAVLQIGNYWKETSFLNVHEASEWLDEHINIENRRIYRVANNYKDLDGMGTTIVTAAFIKDEIVIGNVGDSRAYFLDEKGLNLVTVDHTFANELRINGEITEEEAKNHHQRHTLTRSLGVFNKLTVDFFFLKQTDDFLVMLCSDGLTNGVRYPFIEEVLKSRDDLKSKADTLTQAALNNGSTDNITLCLIEKTKMSALNQKKGG